MAAALAYVDLMTFAEAAAIGARGAQLAIQRSLSGKLWRGHRLVARVVNGRGGCAGRAYQVEVSSLPPDVAQKIPVSTRSELPLIAFSAPSKNWKERLSLAVIAAGPAKSAARGAKISELTSQCKHRDGKKAGQPIAAKTLRGWVANYEAKGLTAITRRPRADRGKARVLVSRTWDAAMEAAGVTAANQEAAALKAAVEIKSCWKSGASSASNIEFMVVPDLRDIALAFAPHLAPDQLQAMCRIPSGFVRRFQRARQSYKKKNDAGGWAAKNRPRIHRHRRDLKPMDMVAADVRHSDIFVCRPDGTRATPKMIVFMDLATNRLFAHVVIMPEGEMIRREHVLEAFRAMFADPSWGVPQQLYLDNGGEFRIGSAADDLCAIAQLVRDAAGIELGIFDAEVLKKTGILRSLPYNPQSKIIESIFSIWTRSIEPMFPGFAGGNRMVPKVENQGREKLPMLGDGATIQARYRVMLDFYNAKKQQKGHIRGHSPNERFANLFGEGWQSIIFNPAEFSLTFGNEKFRKVQTGGEFEWRGKIYRHDKLAIRVEERIRIRIPILETGGRIPVLDDKGEVLCVASLAPVFAMRDDKGSKEFGRQGKQLGADVRAEAAGIPIVDIGKKLERAIAELPKAPVPAPMATISSHPLLREAANEATQAIPAPPARSALSRQAEAARGRSEAIRRAG